MAAHELMHSAGVRVPRLHHADPGSAEVAPFVVVEDLPRGSLEELLATDPEEGTRATRALADELAALHAVRREQLGRIADPSTATSGAAIMLGRTLRDISEACRRVDELAPVHDELVALAHELAAAVSPRTDHRLVHAELGPDHVFLAEDGAPVLIDIEGAMFFDLELEHVFLRLRFGDAYRWLARNDLDDARMALYQLAMHVSLVAGPLRLLDGDFPHREGILDIVRWNVQHTLDLLQRV
jgi:aminoglycoside phosphotransferase (APT) family kinase protein